MSQTKDKIKYHIRSTQGLTEFTKKVIYNSGLTHEQVAEKVRQLRRKKKQKNKVERYVDASLISKAVAPKEKDNTGRNGIRFDILKVFHYQITQIFEVTLEL